MSPVSVLVGSLETTILDRLLLCDFLVPEATGDFRDAGSKVKVIFGHISGRKQVTKPEPAGPVVTFQGHG